MIYRTSFYEQTEVTGNNAIAYIWFSHKIAFPGSCVIEGDAFEYEIELIEIPPRGVWMLK